MRISPRGLAINLVSWVIRQLTDWLNAKNEEIAHLSVTSSRYESEMTMITFRLYHLQRGAGELEASWRRGQPR